MESGIKSLNNNQEKEVKNAINYDKILLDEDVDITEDGEKPDVRDVHVPTKDLDNDEIIEDGHEQPHRHEDVGDDDEM